MYQLTLGEITIEEMEKQRQEMEDFGRRADYFDMTADDDSERILLVSAPHEVGGKWYFKMKGPAKLVGRRKAAFEGFVKSAKLRVAPSDDARP